MQLPLFRAAICYMSLKNIYKKLYAHFPVDLPPGIDLLNPFVNDETKRVASIFYNKFYNDNHPRYGIIGINPGRFGAGVTAIPFTDPIRLEKELGIENTWQKKQELSSVFVYDMVHAYGGVEAFYSKFYFTAVSPFGFTKGNKNLNYYDDKVLQERIKLYAVECLQLQIKAGMHTSLVYCFGEGKNYSFLTKLNSEHKLFAQIIPLPHPRFIMQYRLKKKQEYINRYLEAFEMAV